MQELSSDWKERLAFAITCAIFPGLKDALKWKADSICLVLQRRECRGRRQRKVMSNTTATKWWHLQQAREQVRACISLDKKKKKEVGATKRELSFVWMENKDRRKQKKSIRQSSDDGSKSLDRSLVPFYSTSSSPYHMHVSYQYTDAVWHSDRLQQQGIFISKKKNTFKLLK